jgi:uncharacterized protein (DUF1684 family)
MTTTTSTWTDDWLSDVPLVIDGLRGRWFDRDGRATAIDVDRPFVLAPGEETVSGDLLMRALARDGVVALRVLDPNAATRVSLTGIDTFAPDERWVVTGRLETAPDDATIGIDHVDGSRSDDRVAGVVRLELDGHAIGLVAFPAPSGRLQVTFADATNGGTTQQFRFLTLPAPDADGTVAVDLNRAYLPPCAFTDHYLCPVPPPENCLRVAVTAGEAFVSRRA